MNPTESWAHEDLAVLSGRGLRRQLEPLDSPQGAVIRIGAEELINFSSNDYLGLAADSRLQDGAVDALREHGVGAGASRLLVGDHGAHRSLEKKLASWVDASAALLFNSGYSANTGILPALCREGDAIFSDELNHASLIDGCRLSGAEVIVYPHCDLTVLERQLRDTHARRRLICTESVFSMEGDRAPLKGIVELARIHGAAVLVDEAHALGVVGPRGAGLCVELALADRVDVRVGTLGKALGVFGAFAATSRAVSDLLLNRARSFVFSTALPAVLCAAAERAIGVVEHSPELQESLWRNVHLFAEGLRKLGLGGEIRSPIIPIVLGEPCRALDAARHLRSRGILAKAIRPPTVPDGASRLRFSLCSTHRPEHIERALDALHELELARAA